MFQMIICIDLIWSDECTTLAFNVWFARNAKVNDACVNVGNIFESWYIWPAQSATDWMLSENTKMWSMETWTDDAVDDLIVVKIK